MNLLDQFKQTLGDAAANARDVGQNLGAQAAAQLAIKKLQLETVKKTRDLGARVYEWHQSGTLVATGTVPREVSNLCHELDDLNGQLRLEDAKLEAARQEAEDAKRRAAELKDARQMPFITVETEPVQPPQVAAPAAVAPPLAAHTNAPQTGAPQSNATQVLEAAPYQQPISGNTMTTSSPAAIAPHVTAIGPAGIGGDMPGMPNIPSSPLPSPGSNPDMPSMGIPVPGPDMPGIPSIPTSNPDMPSWPTMPGAPGAPSNEPTMPGQPL